MTQRGGHVTRQVQSVTQVHVSYTCVCVCVYPGSFCQDQQQRASTANQSEILIRPLPGIDSILLIDAFGRADQVTCM